jgi:hypothetical protein
MCSHFLDALTIHPLKTDLAPGRNCDRRLAHIGVLETIHDALFTSNRLGHPHLASQFPDFDRKNFVTPLDPVFLRAVLNDSQKVIGFICSHISKSKNGGPIGPPFCTFTPIRPYLEKF